MGYLKDDGEGALEPRELLDPLKLGPAERRLLDDEPLERRPSFLSRTTGPDHSLSVVGELTESSISPVLLVSPALVTEPDVRLTVEEQALRSFSFPRSFSLKSMNILERASL